MWKNELLRSPGRNGVCENRVWKLGSPQMGREGLRMGQILTTKHSHGQDDFTPPSCPQGRFILQHSIMLCQLAPSEAQRFWWKEIVWVWSWEMSYSGSEGYFSGLRFWAVPVPTARASSAAGRKGSDSSMHASGSCLMQTQPCDEALQIHQLTLHTLGDVPRKQSSRVACFPPNKAIQTFRAMETREILTLPFFMGGSTAARWLY